MTDPRPLAGTDLAPCPDCGGELHAEITKDGSEQWWFIECPACHWAHDVDSLDMHTLATAPWTRALWAEVERLRGERPAVVAWLRALAAKHWEWGRGQTDRVHHTWAAAQTSAANDIERGEHWADAMLSEAAAAKEPTP